LNALDSPSKRLELPQAEFLKLSKGRYSKIIRVALWKSIDKYKEIRDRLEAVERQLNLLIDGSYMSAKDQYKS
jgi:hypothetical protein